MRQTVIAREFQGIQGITIDDAAVRAHVIQPAHVMSARSSRWLEDELPHATALQLPHPPAGAAPYFDVDGFGKALHAALKDSVVGYCLRLQQNNSTIYTLIWNWAQTPADNSEGWATNVHIHVASCGKLITAIAMTRLLINKNISYDAPTITHLPTYWAKGSNINKITFRHLMTHRSGFTLLTARQTSQR
jgi:CubicO group peptidase (beta-lactamase class C family)